ncbi:MAG: ATP-binding protein [Deltaproteobacteria bacterium]|nr:ATP-binding protein [Deltaproteobacteria bacterium]
MKRNPFCFGEVVTGEHFTNRINEIKRLTLELGGGNNIFLISPRRYGKTSLIMNVLGHLKTEGFLTFYLDLYKVASLRELLEAYSKGVARSCATKVERFSGFVKEFFPRLRPKVIIGTDGVPSIEIDIQLKERELMESLEEVLDIPEQIAIKRKKPFVVAFDEFQEILNLDGERIEKMMRACFQHHHHVAYVFFFFLRHLLNSMVSDPNRAFYKLGDIMNLKRIEPSEMIEFLRKQFVKGSVKVSDEVLEYILEVSEDVPYNVQYFCHHLWNWSLETKRVEEEDVEEIMDNIIAEQSMNYITLWDGLSLHQRLFLKAISKSRNKSTFSKDFITENALGTPSSIQKSMALLKKKNIIDVDGKEVSFNDVFFREWIKKKMVPIVS